MHDFLVQAADYAIPWIEAFGIIVVVWGIAEALVALALRTWRLATRQMLAPDLGAIRLAMGEKLVLGLEFFLAGDIIETIVVPTWETLGILGGIVVIRTVIVYFLNLELSRGQWSQPGRSTS
jgi:uncharacterized membrane protein